MIVPSYDASTADEEYGHILTAMYREVLFIVVREL